ncbi:5-formyltetrahydrofolate cyclo-ligase [Ceratobasidium sp. AG-Ba]|nr:5-formyltetrahydrofolate cyclo-ligase [Ceratobasidium sp. AG-Ba]
MSVPNTIKTQKAALRKSVLNVRSLLSAAQIKSSSEAITKKLLESSEFQTSTSVSCFLSMEGEVDTDGIVRSALDSVTIPELRQPKGKTLYVPRMNGRVINMLRVYDIQDLDSLEAGKWGIREPSPTRDGSERQEALQNGGLDLIVMPGVAFDRNLARLGYGRGYYDRFINSYAEKYGEAQIPKLVGIALDEQIVESGMIPMESHDRSLHVIITPTESYTKGRV